MTLLFWLKCWIYKSKLIVSQGVSLLLPKKMANSILHLVLQICGTPKPSHKISTLCPSCTSNPTHVTHQLTTTILSKFLYIAKWLNNSLVYSPLSNHFWWTSISTHAQTTQTMIWAIHGQPRKTLNSPPPLQHVPTIQKWHMPPLSLHIHKHHL